MKVRAAVVALAATGAIASASCTLPGAITSGPSSGTGSPPVPSAGPGGSGSASPPGSVRVTTARALSGASPFGSCPAVGQIASGSEVEPSLAADPTDPDHLLTAWQQDRNERGGAMGIVTATTTDGGATWRTAIPPHLTTCSGGPYDLASDPAVSIGPGHAYLSSIAITVTGSGQDTRLRGDVVVAPSSDGGKTWGDPVVVAHTDDPLVSFDKENVLADPLHPGTAYVVWVRYTDTAPGKSAKTNETLLSRTTDGGVTWSSPETVYGAATEAQFHQLAELPDGTVLDAFIEAPTLGGRPPISARVAVIRSTDQGLTWSAPVTAADMEFTAVTDPTGKDPVRGTGQGILLATGPDGSAYVAWSEQHPAGSVVDAVRSDDDGRTWTSPMTVAREANQPMLPAVAVLPDGTVGVSWYDVHGSAPSPAPGGTPTPSASSGPLETEVILAWSTDRGLTWERVRMAGPFDLHTARITSGGDFVGDYDGLVGSRGGFDAVFAMAAPLATSGPTDVFFSTVTPTS